MKTFNDRVTEEKTRLETLTANTLRCFRADLTKPGLTNEKRKELEAAIHMLETGAPASEAKAWADLDPEQRALVAKLDKKEEPKAGALVGCGFSVGIYDPAAVKARLAQLRGGR